MARVQADADLGALVAALLKPSALTELAVLAGCLLLAWLAVRGLRGAAPKPGSIWFGDGVVDGVLFPLLALDTLYINALALIVVLGLWLETKAYFEAAMLIALLGFVGTAVMAKFVMRGDIVE